MSENILQGLTGSGQSGSRKKRVFMLGAGFMQGVAIRAARALGCTVVAADGNPQAVCADEADIFVPIDLKDTAGLIDYARSLQQHGGLDAVFTAATDFSAAVAAVAQACGLPGHPLEAALNATDKVRMRQCFRKGRVSSPVFSELTAADLAEPDLPEEKIAPLLGCFPVVVKPVDSMGARGCRLVDTLDDVRPATEQAVRYSRSGRVIVEECIQGSEFSIEGLIFDGRLFVTALADRHIFFPPYFIEMGHTIPSDCCQPLADEIIAVFEQGVRALGLSCGAVKGDILVRDGKAFVGEIAARLSGGYMSGWTVPYSSGLDITAAALQLALGTPPRLHSSGNAAFKVPLKQHCPLVSAERAWISIPGQIAAVRGLEAARAVPFVKDVFPRIGVGDTAVFPQNNVEKCGNVLSAAPTRTEAVQASEQACRKVVLRLEPHQPETDAFLALLNPPGVQSVYPPNMLQLRTVSATSFEEALAAAAYEEKAGFVLPDFLAAELDTACDVQGRTLKELLRQALEEEPALAAVLCAGGQYTGSGDSRTLDRNKHCADQSVQKNAYWKALIRGGLQGLLYRYDCEQA